MKTILNKLYRSDRDKDGAILKNRDGKPYEKVGIKINEYGDTWINGFGANWNQNWKEGDEIEIEVSESMWNNKKQYQFKRVDRFKEFDERLIKLEQAVFADKPNRLVEDAQADAGWPLIKEEDVNVDDIPF